jgi:hypothetical protein
MVKKAEKEKKQQELEVKYKELVEPKLKEQPKTKEEVKEVKEVFEEPK